MRPDCVSPGRRRFVRTAVRGIAAAGVAAALGSAPRRSAAQSGTPAPTSTALGDGLTVIGGAGGNVVVFVGSAGAALVDSGAPATASQVFARVEALAGRPDVLFNTHWHPDHTGGNDAYGAAGTPIVAHENTRLWMSTEYYVDWQDRTYEPRAPEALPTDTFYSHEPQPLAFDVGGERIEYGHLREAHTDGDIYVFFRDRNVLVAGGAVAAGAYPVLDYATGGWIGGLVAATGKLLELADTDTRIVPGRGPVRKRSDLERQLGMLTAVRGRIEDLMRKGLSADEMIAAGVTAEFDADWGDNRERFVRNVYGGLWWQGRLQNSL